MIKDLIITILILISSQTSETETAGPSIPAEQENSAIEDTQDIVVRDQNGKSIAVSPKQFMIAHTLSVVGTESPKGTSASSIQYTGKKDGTSDFHVELGEGEKITMGSAFAISRDGYLLSAYHVVDGGQSWVLNEKKELDQADNPEVIPFSEPRVVYENKEADFVILKVDFETPNFLNIRKSKIKDNELLYAGWQNGITQGRNIIPEHSTIRKIDGFRFHGIATSAPLLHGDSGSPLIDADGRCCGVSIRTASDGSYAILLDRKLILKIINKDRKANQTVDTTAVSAPR